MSKWVENSEPERVMRAPEPYRPEPWSRKSEIEREIARRELAQIRAAYFGDRRAS